jgi:hypothetical protein
MTVKRGRRKKNDARAVNSLVFLVQQQGNAAAAAIRFYARI